MAAAGSSVDSTPVSYTHLFYHAIGTDDDEKEFFNHGNALLGAFDAAGNMPVSYTHLDVYKRQG